jgi:hypothetical protein
MFSTLHGVPLYAPTSRLHVTLTAICSHSDKCWLFNRQPFPKYRENGWRMREMLKVACSSKLSVAFGAPVGGVSFSCEVCFYKNSGYW